VEGRGEVRRYVLASVDLWKHNFALRLPLTAKWIAVGSEKHDDALQKLDK
jgi:hypothetical protein